MVMLHVHKDVGFATTMKVRPGDLVRRLIVAHAPGSHDSTFVYTNIDNDPALQGINTKRGDRMIAHSISDKNLPALIIAIKIINSHHDYKHDSNMYAFVLWPGVGLGWIWVDNTTDLEHHPDRCYRWELVMNSECDVASVVK